MQDQDHQVSRQLVNFAKVNSISTIRLEKLSGIRQTARTSRKNEKNLHTWSFYRLAQFIEYKAILEGIKVEYVIRDTLVRHVLPVAVEIRLMIESTNVDVVSRSIEIWWVL